MGALNKFLNAIKLNDDLDDEELLEDEGEYYDEDEEGFLDDETSSRPRKSFLDRFARKSSVRDAEDDYDDEYEDEEPEDEADPVAVKKQDKAPVFRPRENSRPEKASRGASPKVTPMRVGRRNSSVAGNMEVCVFRPASMENTREIVDALLNNATVILNLEGIDVELAQRIIDFTSGACYALDGTLQKVSSYIFVLGPANVDISGDLQSIMGGAMPSVRAGY